ncbi:unnamed protein product [Eruca vesicaria subsp. sativa]|uniref:Uncharacterized protein n=1 Tax=Eruca vesicaria subsp. sativa TaxID=29727 RepID=A0ABC8LT12_ERUVS|nr:unnamed protein product [Eruca vesicaria subsp. sativa]
MSIFEYNGSAVVAMVGKNGFAWPVIVRSVCSYRGSAPISREYSGSTLVFSSAFQVSSPVSEH